jgi:hypothetical protein
VQWSFNHLPVVVGGCRGSSSSGSNDDAMRHSLCHVRCSPGSSTALLNFNYQSACQPQDPNVQRPRLLKTPQNRVVVAGWLGVFQQCSAAALKNNTQPANYKETC